MKKLIDLIQEELVKAFTASRRPSPFRDHRREHQAYGTLHGAQHDR